MGAYDLVIGCVGKPSAGKSTFFNAATDAVAKVGNYPFTTIEPNIGVAYFRAECPCKRLGSQCEPGHGRCQDGTRFVPVKLLDVAGLVPGASTGEGLGNKFLNDLCGAEVLIHVVDVSGTTNEKGETTTGYDPIKDIAWLEQEIHDWVFNNTWTKWQSAVRKQGINKTDNAAALQLYLSGYGCKESQVFTMLEHSGLTSVPLCEWTEETVHTFIKSFLKIRFPTLLVLNKCDTASSAKNIKKICKKYGQDRVCVASGLTECFLRKVTKQGFVKYSPGDDDLLTRQDGGEEVSGLKECDEKLQEKVEKARDLVLARFNGTGVQTAIDAAVALKSPICVYPVKSLTTFQCSRNGGYFRDCVLLRNGGTIADVVSAILGSDKTFVHAEAEDGRRMVTDEAIQSEQTVVRLVTMKD